MHKKNILIWTLTFILLISFASAETFIVVTSSGSLTTNEQDYVDLLENNTVFNFTHIDTLSHSLTNYSSYSPDFWIVSDTVSSGTMGTKMRDLTQGILIHDEGLLDEFGICTSGSASVRQDVNIINNTHPASNWTSTGTLNWATSASASYNRCNSNSWNSNATVIGEYPGDTSRAMIITGETGLTGTGGEVWDGRRAMPIGRVDDGASSGFDMWNDWNKNMSVNLAVWVSNASSSPPPADTTPPTISNVTNTSITYNSATITWNTNEASNSTVLYGTTTSLGSEEGSASLVTSHSVSLSGLSASTTYYYNVSSCDSSGNCNTSNQYSFTTNATPPTPNTLEWYAEPHVGLINSTAERIVFRTNKTTNYTLTVNSVDYTSSVFSSDYREVVVTGLSADTQYAYTVMVTEQGTGYNLNYTGSFHTSTSSGTDWYFFGIGDSRDTTANQGAETPDIVSRIIENSSQIQLDFGLHVGDAIECTSSSCFNQTYNNFNEVWNPLIGNYSMFASLGNHDSISHPMGQEMFFGQWPHPPNNNESISTDSAKTYNTSETIYSFTHKNALFVVVDNYYSGNSTIDSGQVEWLNNTLMNSTLKWKFVISQNPFFVSDRYGVNSTIAQNETLQTIFNITGVDAVLSGDIHQFCHNNTILTPEINFGSSGSGAYSTDYCLGDLVKEKKGYTLAHVEGNTTTFTVYQHNGSFLMETVIQNRVGVNDENGSSPDTTPPVISSVSSGTPGETSATITWSTDEASTSVVYYGTTTSYGSTSTSAAYTTSHSRSLSGLSASTRYYYKVGSCDANGNCANSTGTYFDTASTGGGGGGPVSGDGVSTITFKAYEYITNDLLTDYTLYTGYGLLGTESSSGFTTTSNGYDFNWSTASVKSVSEGSGGNDDSVYQFLFDSQYVGTIYYKGKITTSAVSTQTNNLKVQYYDGSSWNTIESNSCSNSCTANIENNHTLNLNISGLRFSFHSGDIGSGWDATYTVYELGFHGINNTEGDVLNYTGDSEETIVLAVDGYYSQEVSFSVSDDTDSTVNVMDFYNTILSIDLRDAISGILVTAGDQYVTVTDFNGWEETYTTSDGELDLNLTSSITTYGFTGWADNYAFNYVNTSVSAMTDGLNISLYANNSIYINVYDSTNGTSLDNYTATLTGGSNVYTESVGVGTYPLNFTDITSGIYRLIIERNGYLDSEYIVTMTEGSFQFLNAYLYTGSETVIFSLADNGNANPVENASVSMFKILNGSRILVNNKLSDVTGRVQLGYNTGDYYEFIVVAEGYENKEFILNPILFSSYNILLTPTASTAEDTDYSSVLITFSTEDYYINQSNSLGISIYSPDGSLQDYQFNITTELGTQAYSGTNAAGETFTYNFTLPTSPENQTVRISYCYDLTLSEQRCFVKKYTVIGAYDEQSLKALQDNTFGLGLLERLIIATIFSIFVAGLVAAVSGVIGGAAIGMLLFGFFTFTGFIPLWAILPSVLVLAVLIFGRSE